MLHQDTTEFSWKMHAYEHREKSTDWYWALGIIVVVGSAIGFITGNLLFGFLILLGGILVGLLASKKQDPLSIAISVTGFSVNGSFINFQDTVAFWMYRNPFGTKKLLFKTRKNFNTLISIPISDDVTASELREFLLQYVPEQELQESFTDLLLERIGF
jgi:hypothetical protein